MRLLGRIAVAVFALLVILIGFPGLLLISFTILLGWIPAAMRLGGNLPFSGTQLALFFGGTTILVLGAHWFLQQFSRWSFRWTLAFTGTIAFVLLAVMSAVGVAHQFGWILLSKEPVFAGRGRWVREQVDLMKTAQALRNIAPSNFVGCSQAILSDNHLPNTNDNKRPWEKYNLLLIEPTEPTNGFVAIVWPRDERMHRRIGFACIYPDGTVSIKQTNTIPVGAQQHASNHY